VSSVEVHDDVGQVELLKSVRNSLTVTVRRLLAGCQVGVGDQVGERIRLDDECESDIGVRSNNFADGWRRVQ
jgi:hypothetical protein